MGRGSFIETEEEDTELNARYLGKRREILQISSLWNYWESVLPPVVFTIFLCFALSDSEPSLAHCLSVP